MSPERRYELFLLGLHCVKRTALAFRRKLPFNVDIDDLRMEGVVVVLEALRKWDDDGSAQFSSYLFTRLRGVMTDFIRHNYGAKAVISPNCFDVYSTAFATDKSTFTKNMLAKLMLLDLKTKSLTLEDKLILELYFMRGHSQHEIARRTGKAFSTICYRIAKAVNKVRKENKI